MVSVVTLQGHPLAGYRYWRVFEVGNGNIKVETSAADRAYRAIDRLFCKDCDFAVLPIWHQYMEQILRFTRGNRVTDAFNDLFFEGSSPSVFGESLVRKYAAQ